MNQAGNEHSLPKAEEDDDLDTDKLGKGPDGPQLAEGGMVKEDEAVHGPDLACVHNQQHVNVHAVEACHGAVAVHARKVGNEGHQGAHHAHNYVLKSSNLGMRYGARAIVKD